MREGGTPPGILGQDDTKFRIRAVLSLSLPYGTRRFIPRTVIQDAFQR